MFSKRFALPTSLLVTALFASACDDAASKTVKAEQAQAEADQKKNQAEQRAAQKTAEAWDAAGQQADKAQQSADRAWDAAAVALNDEKNDYAGRINKVVGDIDARLTDITASAMDAAVSQKRLTKDVVDNMSRRRDALIDDERALEHATSDGWAALRLKVDTDLDESRTYMRTASARIKASSPR
jgi:hypothetical protein